MNIKKFILIFSLLKILIGTSDEYTLIDDKKEKKEKLHLSDLCIKETTNHYPDFLNQIYWDVNDKNIQDSDDFISQIKLNGAIFQYQTFNAIKVWKIRKSQKSSLSVIEKYLKRMQQFPNELYIHHQSLDCAYYKPNNEETYIFSISKYMTQNLEESLQFRSNTSEVFPFFLDRALKMILALFKIHHIGYIHNSIEPRSILLDDIYTPVLADLTYLKSKKSKNLMAGNKGIYQDPAREIQEDFSFDQQSDIYSLGMVLLNLFSLNNFQYTHLDDIIERYVMIEEQENQYHELKNLFFDMVKIDKEERIKKMKDVVIRFLEFYKFYYTTQRQPGSLDTFWLNEMTYYNNIDYEQEKFKKIFILQKRKKLIKALLKGKRYEKYLKYFKDYDQDSQFIVNEQGEKEEYVEDKEKLKPFLPPQFVHEMDQNKKKIQKLENELQEMKEREESSEESEENVFMRIISVFNICETKRKKKLII